MKTLTLPNQIAVIRSIRKTMPPPRKVFAAKKGAYDRKREKHQMKRFE